MKSVGITASLHDTSGLLVNDLDLIVIDHIFHILVKESVCLEKLVDGMHTLRLDCIILKKLIFFLTLFIGGQVFVLNRRQLGGNIGKNEELRILGRACKHFYTLVGKLNGMVFLIYHKEERFNRLRHLAVVVLHIFSLDLEHKLLDSILTQEADQRAMFRESLVNTEERESAFFRLTFGNLVLGIEKEILGKFALGVHDLLHVGLEVVEHLVVTFGHRTGDDKRSSRVVYKNRVNLIDNRVIMFVTLNEVFSLHSHIVAEIVETEFVVGSERYVATICVTALFGVGLRFVDAVHSQSMELIQRSHPFRVSFRKVIVNGNHVHTLSRKCIQEHRQGSHKGLSLTCSHLRDIVGYLSIVHQTVEHHTSDKLHIIMHHIPLHEITASHPFVLIDSLVSVYCHEVLAGCGKLPVCLRGCNLDGVILLETACRLLDNRENLRQCRVKFFRIIVEHPFAEIIYFLPQRLALVVIKSLDFCANGSHLIFIFLRTTSYAVTDSIDTSSKLVV